MGWDGANLTVGHIMAKHRMYGRIHKVEVGRLAAQIRIQNRQCLNPLAYEAQGSEILHHLLKRVAGTVLHQHGDHIVGQAAEEAADPRRGKGAADPLPGKAQIGAGGGETGGGSLRRALKAL